MNRIDSNSGDTNNYDDSTDKTDQLKEAARDAIATYVQQYRDQGGKLTDAVGSIADTIKQYAVGKATDFGINDVLPAEQKLVSNQQDKLSDEIDAQNDSYSGIGHGIGQVDSFFNTLYEKQEDSVSEYMDSMDYYDSMAEEMSQYAGMAEDCEEDADADGCQVMNESMIDALSDLGYTYWAQCGTTSIKYEFDETMTFTDKITYSVDGEVSTTVYYVTVSGSNDAACEVANSDAYVSSIDAVGGTVEGYSLNGAYVKTDTVVDGVTYTTGQTVTEYGVSMDSSAWASVAAHFSAGASMYYEESQEAMAEVEQYMETMNETYEIASELLSSISSMYQSITSVNE